MSTEQRITPIETADARKSRMQGEIRRANTGGAWLSVHSPRSIERGILPQFAVGARELRETLTTFKNGEASLLDAFRIFERSIIQSGEIYGRNDTRLKSYVFGYNLVNKILRDRAVLISIIGTRIPGGAVRAADDMSKIVGRAFAYEDVADLPDFEGAKNIPWIIVQIFKRSGTVVRFLNVQDDSGQPNERITIHTPIRNRRLDPTQLGCWMEGDEHLYRAHSWDESCAAGKPVRSGAPKRQVLSQAV